MSDKKDKENDIENSVPIPPTTTKGSQSISTQYQDTFEERESTSIGSFSSSTPYDAILDQIDKESNDEGPEPKRSNVRIQTLTGNMYLPALKSNEKKKVKKEGSEGEPMKKQTYWFIVVLLCVVVFAGIIFGAFIFLAFGETSPRANLIETTTGPTTASPTLSPQTKSPTLSPQTKSPTLSPETRSPTDAADTLNPTTFPTEAPTATPQTPQPVSSTLTPTTNEPTSEPTLQTTRFPTESPTTTAPTTNPTSKPTTAEPTTSEPITAEPTSFEDICADAPDDGSLWKFCIDSQVLGFCREENTVANCADRSDGRNFCKCTNGELFKNSRGCVPDENVDRNCDFL